MLKEKDSSPQDIVVLGDKGQKVSLKDLLGSYAVLYFYPKDNTPGCTKEACSFRDYDDELTKLGVKIVGVSKDSPDSHQKFKQKHRLNFPLWSDEEHQLMKAFGVWQQKKFMGKEYMGTTRSTFVINPEGKIIKVWEEVKPDGHAQKIWEFLKEYMKEIG